MIRMCCLFAVILGIAYASGCANVIENNGSNNGDGGQNDEAMAPLLTIESPERGTQTDEPTIVVRGIASDNSGMVEVTVNGSSVEITSDGRFEAIIPTPPGLVRIETIAFDPGGNSSRDLRSVLAGRLVDQSRFVDDAMVAHIDGATLQTLAETVENVLQDLDLTSLARQFNPMVNLSIPCVNAEVDVRTVRYSSMSVSVTPRNDSMRVAVIVRNPVVSLNAAYDTCLIDGNASVTITASTFTVTGIVGASLDNGRFDLQVTGSTGAWTGFDLSVGSIPQSVVNLIEGPVQGAVASAIVGPVADELPPIGESFLDDFAARSYVVRAEGEVVDVVFEPTELEFTPGGGRIHLGARAQLRGVSGSKYFASPAPAPTSKQIVQQGIEINLADDFVNQIAAGFWASGNLNQTLVVQDSGPTAIFGQQADYIDITLKLPPVAIATEQSGGLHLAVADLIIVVRDRGAVGTIAEFAVSTEIELRAETDASGQLTLVTGPAQFDGQVVYVHPDFTLPINDESLPGLAEESVRTVSMHVNGLLKSIPLPAFAGIEITRPTVEGGNGYLLIGASIK